MTLLEKAMQEHPTLDEDGIISFLCPCDFGYETLDDGCNPSGEDVAEVCGRCWNRETPSTAEAVPLPQTRQAAGGGKEGGAGDGV